MESMRRIFLAAMLCAFATSNAIAEKKDEGRMGAWKLNVEKSKYSPGPAPKSLMLMFEPAGKGVHLTTEQINADGSKTATEYTASYDGKDVPLKGVAIANTTSLKRVNSTTVMRTDKKAGKVVSTLKSVLSKDGKTYTVDVKSVTSKGEPVKNFLVFERP